MGLSSSEKSFLPYELFFVGYQNTSHFIHISSYFLCETPLIFISFWNNFSPDVLHAPPFVASVTLTFALSLFSAHCFSPLWGYSVVFIRYLIKTNAVCFICFITKTKQILFIFEQLKTKQIKTNKYFWFITKTKLIPFVFKK